MFIWLFRQCSICSSCTLPVAVQTVSHRKSPIEKDKTVVVVVVVVVVVFVVVAQCLWLFSDGVSLQV